MKMYRRPKPAHRSYQEEMLDEMYLSFYMLNINPVQDQMVHAIYRIVFNSQLGLSQMITDIANELVQD